MAERRIRFYLIVDEQGQRFRNDLPFDDIRDDIRNLPDSEAYVTLPRFEVLGSAYDVTPGAGARPAVPLIALDRITRDPRFRIQRQRNYRPLALDKDETLAEPSFISIFPKNVIGVLRNSGAAPSASSFRDYINSLKILDEQIEILPLADKNAVRALASVDRITKLYFAVGPDVSPEVLQEAPTVSEAIHAVRHRLGHVGVEISIKVSQASGYEASEQALREIRELARGDGLGAVEKASMSYKDTESGRAATYDFLEQSIVTEVAVDISDETSQPTEQSVAEAFAEGYERVYDDVQSSLGSLTGEFVHGISRRAS